MNFISTFEELDKLYEDFSSEESIEEGIFGIKTAKDRKKEVDAYNAELRKNIHAKNDAARTKALENTPVVVQFWRDKSHKPEILGYFDSHMAAEAVEKRHAMDVDKSIVYRYMTAKEAEAAGAFVSLPSKYINKYLNEAAAYEKITWELSNNLGPVVKQTFDSKEEALMYANKSKIGNATQLVGTRYDRKDNYIGNIEYKIKNFGNNGSFDYNIVESCNKNLQEDSDAEIEVVEDEAKQVVLECKKCGALVVIDEADLKNGEDSDLVNIDDECKFCSEKEGYSVIGTLVPYEAEVEEETEEETEEKETEEKELA